MIDYTMLCGWKISFPEKWAYEDDTESGQNIFYLPDSDLTIRITPFHVEKQGVAAPIEVMEEAFLRSVPKSAIPSEIKEHELNNFSVKSYEYIETQNGNTVFRIMVGYYAPGELLSINIFGTSKAECNKALAYLKTLQRDTSIKMVSTDKDDKPKKGRKYYSAGQGKPPIFIQAILYAPVFAWASLHGKDAKEYPHSTKFCYETMSNFEGWKL